MESFRARSTILPENEKVSAKFSAATLRRDALAGTVTGLIAVPLTIGICLMSEYPIQTGLVTVIFACTVSFVTYLFRPGNYVGTPGVAAGLAPVLALSVHKFGMDNMPFLIFLTAVSQMLAWRYDLQRFILKAVPNYLIEGLLAGIGLKIALKFLPYSYEVLQHDTHWFNAERLRIMAISAASMVLFVYLFFKYKARFPAIPYVVVIASGIVLAQYVPLPMLHIEPVPIKLALPLPNMYKLTPLLMAELIGYALMLSLIDVIEQVTSNKAIEKLDPYKRPADTNNSLLAIWIANLGSSFFGGMTNLDGLAKSSTNALAGAVSKISNLFTALVLLVFLLNPRLLTYLPEYSLAVLMIFTGWKMIAGLAHVAAHGQYPLILALFCGILVFEIGIFEGLLLVLIVHGTISYAIYRHEQLPVIKILQKFLSKFSDPVHPHSTETMTVHADGETGGMTYSSVTHTAAEKKNLSQFISDWAFGINNHNLLAVVSTYDANGLLWGTFARELREGHANIRKYFEHLFELENLSVVIESGEVRQYGNIFIQSGKYVFAYEKKNERVDIPARYSFVCKKEKTGWYIVEHHSSQFPS